LGEWVEARDDRQPAARTRGRLLRRRAARGHQRREAGRGQDGEPLSHRRSPVSGPTNENENDTQYRTASRRRQADHRDRGCLNWLFGTGRVTGMALSEWDRAILDFERSWWAEPGPKEVTIRDRFGLSPTRYYQVLNELLDSSEAIEYDPLVVRRLR